MDIDEQEDQADDISDVFIELEAAWGALQPCLPSLERIEILGPLITFGRSKLCDVVLPDLMKISKEHFFLMKEDNCTIFLIDVSKNGTFINGKLIPSDSNDINRILLQHNDTIAVGEPSYKIFNFELKIKSDGRELELPGNFGTNFVLGGTVEEKIAKKVQLAFEKTTCKTHLLKRLKRSRFKTDVVSLRNLSYPFLVNLVQVFDSEKYIFMLTEYIDEENLHDFVQTARYNYLNHIEIKHNFNQILLGLQYLHQNRVIHKNLKPKNIFILERNCNLSVKLSDYGLNELIDDSIMSGIFRGLPNFIAPELLDAHSYNFDERIDVWSLGGVLYYMIYKRLPFIQNDGNFYIPFQNMKLVSNVQLNQLIKEMLKIDPDKRITLNGVLKHSWMKKDLDEITSEDGSENRIIKKAKLEVFYV